MLKKTALPLPPKDINHNNNKELCIHNTFEQLHLVFLIAVN